MYKNMSRKISVLEFRKYIRVRVERLIGNLGEFLQ